VAFVLLENHWFILAGHENGEEDPGVKSPNGQAEENGKVDDQPRALHRTTSIFLRNLAPTITKAEVDAMCKR
jgi:hypothetical protein